MFSLRTSVFCSVLLASLAGAAPTSVNVTSSSSATSSTPLAIGSVTSRSSATSSTPLVIGNATSVAAAADSTPTVPLASDNPNEQLWNETTNIDPEPIRGQLGAPILGPQNVAIDKQNADFLAPPTTDEGSLPNAKWPFSLSHNRLQTGGWVRQQNINQMPFASGIAGADMRLEPGAIRELHWHSTAEWAYVLSGSTQITSVDQNGRNYLATVGPGDLWYFPAGIPHSLQATNDSTEGSEFILVFPSGTFSDDDTFLLTDWLAHIPKDVLARNFQTDISAFNNIPGEELYIFPGTPPADNAQPPSDPQGQIPEPFSYEFSKVTPTQYAGGTVKIADSTKFNISKEIAVAEVTVEPGAMREIHWHPTQDEWAVYLEGQARMTIFAAESTAATMDLEPGDISYVPASFGHYVENTGNTTLRFLEISKSLIFQDVSLAQWLALTPPALVQAHLGVSNEFIQNLNKTKGFVVGN